MGHNSIAMTPDGQLVVDGSGSIYNKNGTRLWSPDEGPAEAYTTVAISNNGRVLVLAEGNEIRIFKRR